MKLNFIKINSLEQQKEIFDILQKEGYSWIDGRKIERFSPSDFGVTEFNLVLHPNKNLSWLYYTSPKYTEIDISKIKELDKIKDSIVRVECCYNCGEAEVDGYSNHVYCNFLEMSVEPDDKCEVYKK